MHRLLWLCPLILLLAPSATALPQTTSFDDALEWRTVGPASFGGRIIDLAVPADEPWTILAASATGGLWRSANHGTTWTCIFENQAVHSIGDIAIDPNDSKVLWVGTGEANNQRSSYWGDGVYKSTDGGGEWSNVGLPDSGHIGRIVVDPTNSDIVYVAALGHLYKPNPERGLYKTTDGGASWTRVLGIDEDVGVVDVILHPTDSNIVLAASYERRRRAWNFDGAGPGSAIHRSADGGRTWTRLEGGLPDGEIGRIGLDVSPQAPHRIYATVSNQNAAPEPEPERPRLGVSIEEVEGGLNVTRVTDESVASRAGVKVGDVLTTFGDTTVTTRSALGEAVGAVELGAKVALGVVRDGEATTLTAEFAAPRSRRRGGSIGGEIYVSEDAGVTWEKVNEQPVGGSPAYYYGQIRVDPQDDQTLYILSVPVSVSKDGGKTWEGNLAGSVHVDHHALWIDPRDSNRLILGNDGGLAISTDRGASWDHVNNIPLAQFYAVAVDQRTPYRVYGGTQDNGTWMGPSRTRGRNIGNGSWSNIGGGDGFQVAIDPDDPNYVYLESQFGSLQRVDLALGSGTSIRPPASDPDSGRDRYNWMSPLLISPHSGQTIYFGSNKLFKSFDRGTTWHVVSPDLTTQNAEKIAGNVPHCTITTIAESPLTPDRLLVGTDDGNVQWSDDGGRHWINCAGLFPNLPPRLWVSRVICSEHDADTAYVSFTGYREDDRGSYLYRTSDAGESWVSIVGDLRSGGVNVVREDPRLSDVLYVGTELGAYATLDGGVHWIHLASGLPTQAVHDLAVHPRDLDLVAGTHGRGFYILDIAPVADLASAWADAERSFALCAPQDTIAWRRLSRQSEGFSGDRGYRVPNPAVGASFYVWSRDGLDGTLRVENEAGEIVRTLEVPSEAGVHRISWGLDRQREEEDAEAQGDRRARFGRGRASRVPPGRYTAVLTVGDEDVRHRFEVRSDPLDAVRAPPVWTDANDG